jgi:hypothetical protein
MTTEQNPYACSNRGCVLSVPGAGGMRTNSLCHCVPLKMSQAERVNLRRGIRWLAERAAQADR